jgi:hypothetical protein
MTMHQEESVGQGNGELVEKWHFDENSNALHRIDERKGI